MAMRLGLAMGMGLNLLIFVDSVCLAVTNKVRDKPLGLDYIVFEIPTGRRMVKAGDELVVIRGDQLTILDAVASDPERSVRTVNFVGFVGGKNGLSREDRGLPINTANDLLKRWSLHRQGEVYRVRARDNAGNLLGGVRVRVVSPRLEYVEALVNGKPVIFKQGILASINRQDRFKVKRVVTNMEQTEDISFQIVRAEDGSHPYEMTFLRLGEVFGRIPLEVR